jgi:hypothetical protein
MKDGQSSSIGGLVLTLTAVSESRVTRSVYTRSPTLTPFSYPDSIRTRARRFLRCIPSQVCFEPLTRTSFAPGLGSSCAVFLAKCALNL